MTAQFQFFQSLPHKKADFVKKKPAEHGVLLLLVTLDIGPGPADEAFHAEISVTDEVVWRWTRLKEYPKDFEQQILPDGAS